ncbi:MAG: hypothetical protein WD554_00245 [Flavobacteriaceae bacterium]
MKKLILGLLLGGAFLLNSCGDSTSTVESGTYQGTIDKVEASKEEIYVKTEDGKTLELYFTDETELSKNGNTVDFSALQEGQNVEVTIEKVGKRLDPLVVKILE